MFHLPLLIFFFFFLMIRRPPRSTQSRSSAASDVYKRQGINAEYGGRLAQLGEHLPYKEGVTGSIPVTTVSYTHLRAHETVLDLVCRLLLEKKKKKKQIKESINKKLRI
eukprot:TRINITY_DN195_c0_g1_i10.p1 TRINITY_DN195_c0_g1~~TRINITY_DN195_c0_g1_i10.p1  ORF type:complete len:109 (-),score=76.81 TRINITY_DN195_c0_g1_i10:37-363(-)